VLELIVAYTHRSNMHKKVLLQLTRLGFKLVLVPVTADTKELVRKKVLLLLVCEKVDLDLSVR
jgi:hypothetical protein